MLSKNYEYQKNKLEKKHKDLEKKIREKELVDFDKDDDFTRPKLDEERK